MIVLPSLICRLLSVVLPLAEREEVLADLESEYQQRHRRGALAARVWLARQVMGSLPSLVRRTWWRGASGFEPRARLQVRASAYFVA